MTLYSLAITLVLVMDPLGNIPIFLSILQRFSHKRQIQIIVREVIIAFCILCFFLFCGPFVMRCLNLSMNALSIAGGIILFLIAIRMIFPTEKKEAPEKEDEPFIVPLAIPLIAGPSAIATVLLFASRQPHQLLLLFSSIVAATLVFLIIMLCSPYLMRILGRRGLVAIERLMGMLLTAIAVQMFLSGIEHLVHSG